jgi:hypothetical protein
LCAILSSFPKACVVAEDKARVPAKEGLRLWRARRIAVRRIISEGRQPREVDGRGIGGASRALRRQPLGRRRGSDNQIFFALVPLQAFDQRPSRNPKGRKWKPTVPAIRAVFRPFELHDREVEGGRSCPGADLKK